MPNPNRRPGSGLANATAAAVEMMLAAAFAGDDREVSRQERLLRVERTQGRCGTEPFLIRRWIHEITRQSGFRVHSARTQTGLQTADVTLELRGGDEILIEVKAQTTKFLRQITEADWVKDETDALRWLAAWEPRFQRGVPDWVLQFLEVPSPRAYFRMWDFSSLWLADMALLPTPAARARAGVTDVDELWRFIDRKFIFHLGMDGARLVPLSGLAPIRALAESSPVELALKHNKKAEVAVLVASPGPPGVARTQFTYHVGYSPTVFGRHKMHAAAFNGARFLEVPRG